MIIIRENTEGEYSGLEHETTPGIVESLKVCQEIAENEYPEIKFDSMIVDNASMQLVSRPQQFDIMLMPNLYGNIISNIACGLVGGPGLVSGMNIGNEYAVFETGTRNTGTSLAGKDAANPTAFIRASADMLRYLGLNHHANMISDSLYRTLVEKRLHTPDIGGTAKTSEVVKSVLEFIAEEMEEHKWRAR
ncbi:dehydrogenase, isocitrate/isopropylmalate family [Teladorsagia circumcincta]|uniref:Dehydrogenase, isocitrate/isopropylmalate family n=2 Tax=Teladorsagia circumcincta TaxID=45464 RepID=A0A2G9V5J8_TELCI|nr:dehydrogenase, isocitrate/isopropylmalate family [Teladorsagia circumcincta]